MRRSAMLPPYAHDKQACSRRPSRHDSDAADSRRTLGALLLGAVLLAASGVPLVPGQASGMAHTVSAKGKDAATAELNARAQAVRMEMRRLVPDEMVRLHTEALRKGIILKAADFTAAPSVIRRGSYSGGVQVEADVQVDEAALAEALASIVPGLADTPLFAAMRSRTERARDFAAIFGSGVVMSPESTPVPFDATSPRRAEALPGASLRGVPDTVRPGEEIVFHCRVPEGFKKYVTAVLCRSDIPDDADIGRWQIAKDWANEREDMFVFKAPVVRGRYEVRIMATRGKEDVCAARREFVVDAPEADVPKLSLDRSVFAPEERMTVRFTRPQGSGSMFIAVAPLYDLPLGRDIFKKHWRSYPFRETGDTFVLPEAPAEPGRYALYLFSWDDIRTWEMPPHAAAVLPFEVREPLPLQEHRIAVPERVEAGIPAAIRFSAAAGSDTDSMEWRIVNAADGKTVIGRGMKGQNARAFEGELPEGSYKAQLTDGDGGVLAEKEFSVAPPGMEYSLTASARRIPPQGAVMFTAAAPGWSPDAWLGIVPAGTPAGASEALAAAGEHTQGLGRKMIHRRVELAAPGRPGSYEIRMYAYKKGNAGPLAVLPLEVMDEKAVSAEKAALRKELDEFLAAPAEDDGAKARDILRRQFLIPEIPRETPGPDGGPLLGYSGGMLLASAEGLPVCGPVSDAPGLLLAEAKPADCRKEIDAEIAKMRRINITLGHDNHMKDALQDFARDMVLKFPVKGDVAQKIQKMCNVAYDSYTHGTAGIKSYEEGDYLGAAQNAMAVMLKGAVNICDSKDCQEKLRGFADDSLRAFVKKCSDSEYKTYLAKAAKELGDKSPMLEKIERLRSGADYAMNVDVGTAAGEASSGGMGDAAWTLCSGVVTTAYPPAGVVIAAAKAAKESALAVRDLVTDYGLDTVYSAYKTAVDGGSGHEELKNLALVRVPAQVRDKARRVMASSLYKKEVLESLSAENREKARRSVPGAPSPVRTSEISDSEVDAFLVAQFEIWKKDERNRDGFAKYAESIRRDYMEMPCRWRFLWARRAGMSALGRIGDSIDKSWNGTCRAEAEAFAAYAGMRSQIEGELARWSAGSGGDCTDRTYAEHARDMVCTLLSGGRDAYLESVVTTAQVCNWKVVDSSLLETARNMKLRDQEYEIEEQMKAIGREDVLGCLCYEAHVASQGTRAIYHPEPTKESPSCEGPGGACIGGNFGCFRFRMATTPEALRRCEYAEAFAKKKEDVSGPVCR